MVTVHELFGMLKMELYNIRRDVETWGLDALGVERVRWVCNKFESDSLADVEAWEKLGPTCPAELTRQYAEVLGKRLEYAKQMKPLAIEVMEKARRCEWLAGWYDQANGDVSEGLGTVLGHSKRHSECLN